MKTRKPVFLALFALVVSCGLIFFGCDLLFPPDPGQNAITFTVTANTPSGKNTESLDIRFSEEVPGLTVADISLSASNVTKGNLSGGGANYNLTVTVSGFAGSVPCSVTINKTGVSSSAQSVGGGVVNNEGKADYTVNPSKIETAGTATLTIALTKEVTLSADQITITKDVGEASRGALTGSGKSYELAVSGAKPGAIKIKINNTQVNDAEKTVNLEASTTTPGTGVPVSRITIVDNQIAYAKNIEKNAIETGYPKQLTAVIHPDNAENKTLKWESLDPDIVTVNEKGIVSAGPNKQGRPYDDDLKTTIYAKSTDGSEVEGSIDIKVVDKIDPSGISIEKVEPGASGIPYTYIIKLNGNSPNFTGNEFPMGDKGITLTVSLVAGSNATNDQSMVRPPKVTSNPSGLNLVSVTQVGDFQENEDVVPLKRFLIKPADYKADLENKTGTITFSSTSDTSVTATISFKLIYDKVKWINKPITFMNDAGTPLGTTANFKDVTNSVIIATVNPNAPYKTITLYAEPGYESWIKIDPYGNQGNQFKIRKMDPFEQDKKMNIYIKVEDSGGKVVNYDENDNERKTLSFEIQWGTPE